MQVGPQLGQLKMPPGTAFSTVMVGLIINFSR